jgi:hypothetical protein
VSTEGNPLSKLIDSAYRAERLRIRRAIAPHLKVLKSGHFAVFPTCSCVYCESIRAIDADTRAPRRKRARR